MYYTRTFNNNNNLWCCCCSCCCYTLNIIVGILYNWEFNKKLSINRIPLLQVALQRQQNQTTLLSSISAARSSGNKTFFEIFAIFSRRSLPIAILILIERVVIIYSKSIFSPFFNGKNPVKIGDIVSEIQRQHRDASEIYYDFFPEICITCSLSLYSF